MKFEDIKLIVEEMAIPGWLLPEERRLLYDTALGAETPIVELGSYCGLSTLFLAAALEERDEFPGPVWAVDDFGGQKGRKYREYFWGDPNKIRVRFRETIAEAGLTDYVTLVVADTIKASVYFEDESIGFIFIDADHRLEGVRADYEVWYRKLAPGAPIAMHNANGCGVRDNKVVHAGVMAVFSNAILRGEIVRARLVRTVGIGHKRGATE